MAESPTLGQAGPEDVKRALAAGVAVVDIRRDEEWRETGIIEGASTITAFTKDGGLHPEFTDKFSALVHDPEAPVMLYCRTGVRTGNLGAALIERDGFTQVGHLAGGIFRWLDEGHPVIAYPG